MRRECLECFPRHLRVSDPDMHHDTCVAHVPCCILGSLTIDCLWSLWQGKRSLHSWRMGNPQFYVSGKRPMAWYPHPFHRSTWHDWDPCLGYMEQQSRVPLSGCLEFRKIPLAAQTTSSSSCAMTSWRSGLSYSWARLRCPIGSVCWRLYKGNLTKHPGPSRGRSSPSSCPVGQKSESCVPARSCAELVDDQL